MSVERIAETVGPGRRSGRAGARRLGLGAVLALAGVGLTALVVARVGTETLIPSPAVWSEQQAHGTWHEMFDLDGLAAAIPLPLWALALVGAGLIGFPYAWLAARSLPDAGYALSRGVGLLLVTLATWWLSSLRLLTFGRVSIALATAIVAAGAGGIVLAHRRELAAWIRANWRRAHAGEVAFWLGVARVL